jgi:hypothetical protein
MKSFRMRICLASWTGLWCAGFLWAVNTEAGQILPALDCAKNTNIGALVSIVLTVLAAAAGLISWRAARTSRTGFGSPSTIRFDAKLSALGGLVFAFALALQTVATLVLTGCEH